MKKNIHFLIYLFFIKDEEAFGYLREIYQPMVNTIICNSNVSKDGHQLNRWDMLAIADTILLKCLYLFQIGRHFSFTAFYKRVLMNEFKDVYRVTSRQRIPDTYQHVYLDSKIKEEEGSYFVDQTIVSLDPTHKMVMGSIMAKMYLDLILPKLNPTQRKIFLLRLKGYRRIDICNRLKISKQRYDYTIKKVKAYLQEVM